MKLPCPSLGCRRVFRTAVALHFHLEAVHPGGADQARDLLQKARQEEYREKKEDAESRARKLLDELYRSGCACGRSAAWHKEQRARLRVTG